jgi:hypothetical protein
MDAHACPALLALLFTLAAGPAGAAIVYKTVNEDGTVMFSDTPPAAGSRIVEQHTMDAPSAQAEMSAANGVAPAANPFDDPVVARANEQLDQAEHALALARQGMWSPRDGLTVAARRMSPDDEERVSNCTRLVAAARRELAQLLRERQFAAR